MEDGSQLPMVLISILSPLVAAWSFGSLFITLLENAHPTRRNKLVSMADQSCMKMTRLLRKRARNKNERQFWERPGRTSTWWLNFVRQVVVLEEWRDNFRMSRENLLRLCDESRPFVIRHRTNMWVPISIEKQVAVFCIM